MKVSYYVIKFKLRGFLSPTFTQLWKGYTPLTAWKSFIEAIEIEGLEDSDVQLISIKKIQ